MMTEFITGFLRVWILAGVMVHIVTSVRNWRFIRDVWGIYASSLGVLFATSFFVASLVFSIIVWPHVFFKVKK